MGSWATTNRGHPYAGITTNNENREPVNRESRKPANRGPVNREPVKVEAMQTLQHPTRTSMAQACTGAAGACLPRSSFTFVGTSSTRHKTEVYQNRRNHQLFNFRQLGPGCLKMTFSTDGPFSNQRNSGSRRRKSSAIPAPHRTRLVLRRPRDLPPRPGRLERLPRVLVAPDLGDARRRLAPHCRCRAA